MTRGRHVKRTAGSVIVVVAIAVGIVLLALGGVAFAAYRYDRATADIGSFPASPSPASMSVA